MATKTGRGRNLFSTNPDGSKLAYARYEALKKAREAGIGEKVRSKLEMAMSVQAVERIMKQFNLE